MNSNSMFKKAAKSGIKVRLALSGASGSGKTFSALAIASELGKSIAVIDTEHGSASRYADRFDFDVCELTNHHPGQYIQAIEAAEQAGYEVIIIDSLSHAWFSELELAGKSFDGWKNVRPLERKLIVAMVGSPCHVIATMRSKTEYVMEEYTARDGKLKTAPKKIGTAPIQSSGIEYEFDVAGELNHEHILTISKSRCSELTDRTFLNPGREIAEILKNWMQEQVAAPIAPQHLKAVPTPQILQSNPVARSAVADTLHRLKWTDFQIQNCLVVNFDKVSQAELNDEELLDFLDYLAVFEKTSTEIKRLGWTKEHGQAVLKQFGGQETRSNLTSKQLEEFLGFLKTQEPG